MAAAPVYVDEAPVYVDEAPVYADEAPVYVAKAPVYVDEAPPTHESLNLSIMIRALEVESYLNKLTNCIYFLLKW